MILPEDTVAETIATVRTVFPSFQDWEYNNAIAGDYDSFSVWGVSPQGSDPLSKTYFFVTLREQGRRDEKLAIAQAMKRSGSSLDFIAQVTGLSAEALQFLD